MSIEDEQKPERFYLVILLLVLVIITGFLLGLATGIGINVDDVPTVAVEETDPTEDTTHKSGMPLKESTGASAENEAVTEPVTSSGALASDAKADNILDGNGDEKSEGSNWSENDAMEDISEPTVEATEPVTEPVWTAPEAPSEDDKLGLLACIIYQEAGGDAACDDCRRRVADVVLNRMAHSSFPYTIHGVLTQYAQYGRMHWTGVVWPERAKNPSEAAAVERAYRIAEEVLSGHHSELFGKGYIYQAEFIQGQDNIYCCGHYFGR